ncbi:MAG: tetratricopeptide repeat protein [Nitrospirae bacterium]|nr:tetratricopeptide repeat protein [Nitrospirota bacterium]
MIGDLYLKKGSEQQAKESFIKAAELFRKDGFYHKAIAIYKKVLNIAPNDVDALIALAKLNADRGLIGNAIENYNRAAEIYHREGSTEKATMVVEKMLHLAPADTSTRSKIAYLYFRIGLRERAANEYASIAAICLEKNDFEKAKEFYNKAIEYDTKCIPALTGLSNIAVKEKNIEQAFTHLNTALSYDPNNIDILLTYSKLAIDTNKIDDARRALVLLMTSSPSSIEARKLLSALYINEGHPEKAWEVLLPCIDTASNENKWSEADELMHYFKDLQIKPVKQRLLRICKAQGDDYTISNALKELAVLNEDEGSDEDAYQLYKEALALNPDDKAVSEKIKYLEIKLGIAEPLIEERPTATDNNIMLSTEEPFLQTNETSSSIQTDKVLIEEIKEEQSLQAGIDDDLQALFNQFEKPKEKTVNYEAHYIAGLEFKQKGLMDEAIGELQVASKDPDKMQRNSTMLALCYVEKGSYPLAIAEFYKIIESMTPADSTYLHVKYELAKAHLNNKEGDRALQLFSEIQAQDPDFKDVSDKVASLKRQTAPSQEDKPKPKRDRVSYI